MDINTEVTQPISEVLSEIESRVDRYEEALAKHTVALDEFTYEDVAFLLELLRGATKTIDGHLQALASVDAVVVDEQAQIVPTDLEPGRIVKYEPQEDLRPALGRAAKEIVRLRQELRIRDNRISRLIGSTGGDTLMVILRAELELAIKRGNIARAALQKMALRVGTEEDALAYLDEMTKAHAGWLTNPSLETDAEVELHDASTIFGRLLP